MGAAVLAALGGSAFRVFDLYELQTYDWRCQWRGPRPVSSEIVLIDIWDDTLKELGAWPFDRGYHADLIRVLSAFGVKAVGFDVLFVEPRDGDPAVAESARQAGNVYFVYAFLDPKPSREGFAADGFLAPLLESYRLAARGTGHVNTKADPDGKRRRTYPFIRHEGKNHYQLSFRMAMDILGVRPEEVQIHPRRFIDFPGKMRIPLDDEGTFLVNYAGPWEKTFTHYSYGDVLVSYLQRQARMKPRITPENLAGKICFIGLTSLGSHDANPIPLQSVYPMVGSYANVLNSLLNRDFIRRLDRASNVLILLVAAAWVLFLSVWRRPWRALFLFLATLVLYAEGVFFVFFRWGLWVDLFYPTVLFTVIFTVSMLVRAVFEMQKREVIEKELEIASQIQRSFLPETVPVCRGLSLAVYMKPAKAVGGDLYAFIPLGEEKVGVMIGDVSGKGTPAALFMAKVVSEFKFMARDKTDPAEVLADLNRSLSAEPTGGLFVTLAYVIFDMRNRKVLLANGGHLPVVRVPGGGGRSEFVSPEEGLPIGVAGDAPFSNFGARIVKGDIFALYSDGVNEARNRKRQEFGLEALGRVMTEQPAAGSAEQILDRVVGCVREFMGRADQHDDMTLIVAKVISDENEKENPASFG